MQRLLSLKLLSKTSKTLSNNTTTTYSIYSKTSPFLPSTNSPSPQNNPFFSQYSSWTSYRPHNRVFSKEISNGFFSNPSNSTKLLILRNSPSTGQTIVTGLRAQFARRNFHSNFSFDSNRRSWFQRLTTDGVVLGLILTNVAVFLLWRIADPSFMKKNFMISLDNFKSGRIHTIITSAFSHIDSGHIISNMVGLYFFGTSVGITFGPTYLLKLYLAGAVGGSVFYLVHHALLAPSSKGKHMWSFDPSNVPGLGASGAVNAVMLLDIFLFPKKTLYFDFIIPVPAILLGIFLIGKDMLRIMEGDNRISGSAHLGGATVAAIAWARIRKGRFRF
ncbi:unnamed protein product [Coffea canephora]|uniref:DH200=94 genomic scaffold, scaffold_200 n=1 Tax=Coffea canephora TaxID=49390 RepID=A0A068VB39_COFCA|nr:unnamed protein product [Coffea canephora]